MFKWEKTIFFLWKHSRQDLYFIACIRSIPPTGPHCLTQLKVAQDTAVKIRIKFPEKVRYHMSITLQVKRLNRLKRLRAFFSRVLGWGLEQDPLS